MSERSPVYGPRDHANAPWPLRFIFQARPVGVQSRHIAIAALARPSGPE